MKDESDRVAKALKAAANSRSAIKMPLRKGDSTFSVVIDGKAISIDVPWATIQESSETDISKYIVDRLTETAKKVSQ